MRTMEQMKEAVAELIIKIGKVQKTDDILRQAEANNILQVVHICRDGLEKGMDFRDIDELLSEVAGRVDFLLDNPHHAGLHERHRINEQA